MSRWRQIFLGVFLGCGATGTLVGQHEEHAARERPRAGDTDEEAQPDTLPALPPGMSIGQIREGDELYRGKGGCAGCHGANATGMPDEGSALTAGLHFIPSEWKAIDSLVTVGISEPTTRTAIAMPERGEMSDLTPAEIRAVSAYVPSARPEVNLGPEATRVIRSRRWGMGSVGTE